jgi:hypothetical protein
MCMNLDKLCRLQYVAAQPVIDTSCCVCLSSAPQALQDPLAHLAHQAQLAQQV